MKNLTRKFTREKVSTQGGRRSSGASFTTKEKQLTKKILQEQCWWQSQREICFIINRQKKEKKNYQLKSSKSGKKIDVTVSKGKVWFYFGQF